MIDACEPSMFPLEKLLFSISKDVKVTLAVLNKVKIKYLPRLQIPLFSFLILPLSKNKYRTSADTVVAIQTD